MRTIPSNCPELVRPARPELRVFLNGDHEVSLQRSEVEGLEGTVVSIPIEDATWVAEALLRVAEESRAQLEVLEESDRAEI